MKASALRHTASLRALGVVFLALVLFFVWATYAIFTNKFVDFVPVTLQTSSIGLQLPALADVKIRGVRVGEVREAVVTDGGAELALAITPEKAGIIPANVTARILPKTLFGEKYVALQVPEAPSAESIGAGDVIEQAEVAIEVEQVLSDIYPLLRAVQPAQINYTLTAMATALEGRGESIGENLEILDGYLKRTNPQIPELVEDLRLLSEVSDTYTDVVPELARLLRNSVATGETFVDQEQKIEALFADVSAFSSTTRDFLEANGDNIIRFAELGQEQLPLFAKYAPEYPCLLKGIVRQGPRQAEAFRNNTLHIELEMLPTQPTGYTTDDLPVFGADIGPHCEKLPNPPYDQENLAPQPPMSVVDDGVESGHGKFRRRATPGFDLTSGYAGTSAEQSVINSIAAPVMGVPDADVPDLAALLLGPLVRGTEVSVR